MHKRDALAYTAFTSFNQYMGFPKEALEAARQAAELESAALLLSAQFRAFAVACRTHQEAIAAGEAALELQPNHILVLNELCGPATRLRDGSK